jgi:hypothetical protein
MHLNGMILACAPSKDLVSRGLKFSGSRIPLKHEWRTEYGAFLNHHLNNHKLM